MTLHGQATTKAGQQDQACLCAFSGVTVGFVGSVIGIHWSLALSALALLAVTSVLLAFSLRGR